MESTKNELTIILDFLNAINIEVIDTVLPDNTFLPGLQLKGATILLDRTKLKYPGDILHEAGHIAVSEKHIRPLIGSSEITDDWPPDGEEIAAILWSFAASHHLNLDLNVVFHPNGYKGGSAWLIEQFTNKKYVGLPLLEWMSLCNADQFPKMKKWIRD